MLIMNQKKRYKVKLYMATLILSFLLLYTQYSFSAETLTLEKAMETAMTNSPNIKQTELSLKQTQETLNARNASLKSSFSLRINPFGYSQDQSFDDRLSAWIKTNTKSSSGTFTISQPITATDGTLSLNNAFSWRDSYSDFTDRSNKTFNNKLDISFNQPLFTYNTTKMDLRELELSYENTQYNYAIQKLSLEQNITQSFYNLYQNKTNLDISQEELVNQRQSYEIIKNKVEAGLSAQEELYQAELNLANSELSLLNSQVTLNNALDSFKLLLGISIYEDIDIVADIGLDTEATIDTVHVDLDKALNNALQTRMELRQREISLEQAYNSLIRTAAQNEFKGSLTLSYGITGTDEQINNVFDSPTKSQTVGLSFNIPIWDWGANDARIKSSEYSIERQNISSEDERNNIIQAIRRAYRDLQRLVIQIDISRQNLNRAQRTYEINLERYKNGQLSSMDLQLQQTQLSSSKQSFIGTIISYKMAILNMKIMTLWDFENNKPVISE